MKYKEIFDRLWADYTAQNPSTKKIYDLFIAEGETVLNDHIAFRTFDHPAINVDVLSRVFIEKGYEFKGQYHFEEKKLNAKHFEHRSDPDAPRVFISELLTGQFSPYLQGIVKEWVAKIPLRLLEMGELIYAGNVAGTPSFPVYENLRKESEYAAWLYANGFRANHFTVSVNGLKKLDTIQKVNEFLKSRGFLLNDAGGEIQGTPADLLEQSSTRAGIIKVQFLEGTYEIPGCYYEFARRYKDAEGKLYSGFISKSADKIFESTNFYKK
jgi:hypothetical protein